MNLERRRASSESTDNGKKVMEKESIKLVSERRAKLFELGRNSCTW